MASLLLSRKHLAMAEAQEIPRTLDERVKVKQRESGYPESEHILALAANAFVGGDYLEDLEALREDVAIQRVIGRKDLPDLTIAGDFCRRFTLGHLLQLNRAFEDIEQRVYEHRPNDYSNARKAGVDAVIKRIQEKGK
jgi:hypothetical protein